MIYFIEVIYNLIKSYWVEPPVNEEDIDHYEEANDEEK